MHLKSIKYCNICAQQALFYINPMNSNKYDNYQIDPTCLVITPTQKLAFHLNQLHRRDCWRNLSKVFGPSPKIIYLSTWLQSLWMENRSDPRIILTDTLEYFIWEHILREEYGDSQRHFIPALQQAWKIINQHQLPINFNDNIRSIDNFTFSKVAKNFISYCHKHHFLTQAELLTAVAKASNKQQIVFPKKIQFIGFETIHPQFEQLLKTLTAQGSEYFFINPNCQYSKNKVIEHPETFAEIFAAANWCKANYLEHPDALVGFVVPNLEQLRSQIKSIFSQVFSNPQLWHLSLGQPLIEVPICKAIFTALEPGDPDDWNKLSALLLSPYYKISAADSTETDRSLTMSLAQRSLLATKILKAKTEFNIGNGKKSLAQIGNLFGIHLTTAFDSSLKNDETKKPYQEWAKQFSQILADLGWPGEIAVDSHEYQALEHCRILFQQFGALSNFYGKTTYQEALQKLRCLAENTLFQSENAAAPISILGVLEATGINFDYLWIMGMDNQSWPTAPRPNPFIPYQIHKQFNLPHSSAINELETCENLTQRLLHSAREIIFSYSQITDGGEEGKCSPLLLDLPSTSPIAAVAKYPWQGKIEVEQNRCEIISDHAVIPIDPNTTISGGSNLLELQSLCPFRAFAELRLSAKPIFAPVASLHKIERGKLLHRALELFWQEVKTHAQLIKLFSEGEIATTLAQCIDNAMIDFNGPQVLQRLERICLTQLLEKWLQYETSRDPFTVVATEKSASLKIKNLALYLRLDRIDQLDNGQYIIIDYKTGKTLPGIAEWFNNRPSGLQLPIYCLTADNIGGIAYVKINSLKYMMKLITIEDIQQFRPEISSWSALNSYWGTTVAKLAEDYLNGIASIDPIDDDTCKNCQLKILCRVEAKLP